MDREKNPAETQEGKTPIQVVLNDAGEGTVSLRSVIGNMKARKRIFAWVLALCVLAGLCAPLALYSLTKEKATVSSVVTLQYETEEEGLFAPDGTELDLNRMISAEVLQGAIDRVALSKNVSADSLAANLRIRKVMTEESLRTQEAIAGLAKIKDPEAYMTLQYKDVRYTNRFVAELVNGFGLQADELKMLLDRVLYSYNQYLAQSYIDAEPAEGSDGMMIRYTTPEGNEKGWLGENAKKMILGAIAGLVIGIAVWFFAALLPEISPAGGRGPSASAGTAKREKKQRKGHAARNICAVLAVCLIAGTILGVIGFKQENARGAATATVQISYRGASEGKAPDGTALNAAGGMMSREVISDALAAVGLQDVYDAEEILRHLDAAGVYPANTVSRMTGYASLLDGEARMAEYYPTIFKVRLFDNLTPKASADQLKELAQGIVTAWRKQLGCDEKTVAVSGIGYSAPGILSGAFAKRWIKSAGPMAALGCMICMIGMIIVRRKEEVGA